MYGEGSSFYIQMMAKLKDAAKNRKIEVETALEGEIFGICQSLAKNKFALYHGTKSHVTKPLKISISRYNEVSRIISSM